MERKLITECQISKTGSFLFKASFFVILLNQIICVDFVHAKTGTRMRKAKSSVVGSAATLTWTPSAASGNLVDPPYSQTYVLKNTGTASATSLTFSTHIYSGSWDTTTPGNEGDLPNGNYIYISAHDCGTDLSPGQSCNVTFQGFSATSATIHENCTATGGGTSSTLMGLLYDPSI